MCGQTVTTAIQNIADKLHHKALHLKCYIRLKPSQTILEADKNCKTI